VVTNSPILTHDAADKIFRIEELKKRLLNLEDIGRIEDESALLAELVNTGRSKTEALSRWVRYREGYSPSIVRRILEKFPIDEEQEFILDPMCGSGSTQVAAQQAGIASGGTDVSPYAALVSRVKTRSLGLADRIQLNAFLEHLTPDTLPQSGVRSDTERYLESYFPQQNYEVLLGAKRAIDKAFDRDSLHGEFLQVALLATVENCSNRKKDGNGLATVICKVADPLRLFKNQVSEMLQDVAISDWLSIPSVTLNESALVINQAVPKLSKALGKKLGAVIFSPPYANSFDYYESYKLELLFGDFFSKESISLERTKLIRSYRQAGKSEYLPQLPTVELLIREIMSRLPEKEEFTGKRDGRARLLPNMLRGYFEDMNEFLVNAASAMPEGSYMAIVVDQSAYLGVLVPTDLLLAELGVNAGFTFEKLIICRKAKTSGQQLNTQPALSDVLRETAVILRR
jgi:hypothetical protein